MREGEDTVVDECAVDEEDEAARGLVSGLVRKREGLGVPDDLEEDERLPSQRERDDPDEEGAAGVDG